MQFNPEFSQIHRLHDFSKVDRLAGMCEPAVSAGSEIEQLVTETDEITDICFEFGESPFVLLDGSTAASQQLDAGRQ